MALNNLQWLIRHETQPNQIKQIPFFSYFISPSLFPYPLFLSFYFFRISFILFVFISLSVCLSVCLSLSLSLSLTHTQREIRIYKYFLLLLLLLNRKHFPSSNFYSKHFLSFFLSFFLIVPCFFSLPPILYIYICIYIYIYIIAQSGMPVEYGNWISAEG